MTSAPVAAAAMAFRGLTGYLKGVLGADAYQKYSEYQASTGCEAPPLTEREFWRDRMDRQDNNPQGRCC